MEIDAHSENMEIDAFHLLVMVMEIYVSANPRELQNSGMTYLKIAKFWNDRAVYIDKITST